MVHYSLCFTAYKAESGGGFSFDVRRLGRCKACLGRPRTLSSMPRTLQSMPRTAEDVASMPRTLPSMPKHALGTHIDDDEENFNEEIIKRVFGRGI